VRGQPASTVLRGPRRSNAPGLPDRDLRPTKTQQKISGRLTSEDITQDRLDIRSYIDTIRKHKADVITGIRAALAGDPWRPPNSAPT
jgi:transposase